MSNISLFANTKNAVVPDYLKNIEDDFTSRVAGAAQGKNVSIEGGVFRLIVGGEEVAKNEDRAMNFVFINAAPHVSRTYYAGVYVKGQSSSPDCYSPDGKLPAPNVENPQSASCATCPQNIRGSGQGESRACRFSQRFAVLLEGDMGGSVYRLQLSAKSLFAKNDGDKMSMQSYAKFLKGHGVPMTGVLTEARFDTNESVPVLVFKAVRPLTREEYEIAQRQAKSDDALAAVDTVYVPPKETAKGGTTPPPFAVDASDEKVNAKTEPTKRATSKGPTQVASTPAAKGEAVSKVLEQWGSDDDE